MENKIKFACIEVKQPIGTFYMGAVDHKDLIDIAWADVRGLEEKRRDVEIYSGIQRELSAGRVREISKYVNLVDATFPTSVILAVASKDIEYDRSSHTMVITRDQNVAKILDGQHRIAGLKESAAQRGAFQINVVLFVDMELEDQALVFATINKTHTKVNKSLAWDLFDFATTRSPQKTAHNIARALNEKEESPFFGKIKVLGVADDKERETITQATFVESLIKYISNDPMTDRDLYKRKKIPEIVSGATLRKLFLRNLFIDEKDAEIAQIVWNYFAAVRRKWPEAWNEVRVDMVLNKSTGFVALMKFFRDAYLSFEGRGGVIEQKYFDEIFDRIDIPAVDFNKQNYVPGGIGQAKLYKDLQSKSGLKIDEH
jgi:DGQHR domain-containing protein